MKILNILLLALLLFACTEDEEQTKLRNTPSQEEEVPWGSGEVFGYIKDFNSNPLVGVKVSYGNRSVLSQEEGYYKIEGISLDEKTNIVYELEGFAPTYKAPEVKQFVSIRTDVALNEYEQNKTINNKGSEFNSENFSLTIPPDALIYNYDSLKVEGDAEVGLSVYYPSEKEFVNFIPRSFLSDQRSAIVINSYGIINLVGISQGEPIGLEKEEMMTISIRAEQNAPQSLKLFYFAENNIWQFVSDMDNTGGLFQADINKFGLYNIGVGIDQRRSFEIDVVDLNGDRIDDATIIFRQDKFAGFSTAYSAITAKTETIEIQALFEEFESDIYQFDLNNINSSRLDEDIVIPIKLNEVQDPVLYQDTFYITAGNNLKIKGNNFYSQGKIELDGVEIEIVSWENQAIEVKIPNQVNPDGIIRITPSNDQLIERPFKEGPDWECEIGGELHNNNYLFYDLNYPSEKWHFSLVRYPDKVIPDCIENLTNMNALHITSMYNLTSISANIDQLYNLYWLEISECENLENLPSSISNLNALELLYLHNNSLKSIPNEIGKLEKLKQLRIDGNNLNSLPESISNLTNLVELSAEDNNLQTIPNSIFELESLEILELENNNISSLPVTGNLVNLVVLRLAINQIVNMEGFFKVTPNLRYLEIHSNLLESIPESIGQLSKLESIEASYNKLSSLPDQIQDLNNIWNLVLANNEFETFPNEVIKMSNLGILDLSNNNISSLPDSISEMSVISIIKLNSNNLSELPESIKNLSGKLRELHIKDNNFSEAEKSKIRKWLPNVNLYF